MRRLVAEALMFVGAVAPASARLADQWVEGFLKGAAKASPPEAATPDFYR